MAVATAVHGCHFPFPSKSLSSKITGQIKQSPPAPPIYISTNPSHVNLHHLKDLSSLCNHSFHRFPNVDPTGRVEAVDINKLHIAIIHSYVVVSVFTMPELVTRSCSPVEESNSMGIGGDWTRRVMPVTPENGELIGFGRAVSDSRLTASIYDVMVHPALQGRGIGRRIVKKIVRLIYNLLIDRYNLLLSGPKFDCPAYSVGWIGRSTEYANIGALCSDEERLFFRACGFGEDELESTTMMYTRSSSCSIDEETIFFGRKKLLIPPLRKHLKASSGLQC